jgi:hypothetical protein
MPCARRLALCLFALVAPTSLAEAAGLNVKPGLWEMTSTGEATGAPPIPAEYLARMSAEQRAKVQERMAAGMARANQPRVNRQCVSAEELQRGIDVQDEANKANQRSGCQKMLANVTGTVMDMKQTCTGGGQNTTMLVHFVATSPQSVTGHIEVTMSGSGNGMSIKREMTGKWLSADCGALKK